MKKLILILSLLLPAMATAEGTPDGVTPANENVCDVVQGGTPSLYGLCVAFCEAQDHFDPSAPVTEAELDAYLDGEVRAKQIYDKYESRRQAGDPSMPCVVIAQDEPCKCWTDEELVNGTDAGTVTFTATQFITSLDAKNGLGITTDSFRTIETKRRPGCRAKITLDSGYVIQRSLVLNTEELAICKTSLINRAAELGL